MKISKTSIEPKEKSNLPKLGSRHRDGYLLPKEHVLLLRNPKRKKKKKRANDCFFFDRGITEVARLGGERIGVENNGRDDGDAEQEQNQFPSNHLCFNGTDRTFLRSSRRRRKSLDVKGRASALRIEEVIASLASPKSELPTNGEERISLGIGGSSGSCFKR